MWLFDARSTCLLDTYTGNVLQVAQEAWIRFVLTTISLHPWLLCGGHSGRRFTLSTLQNSRTFPGLFQTPENVYQDFGVTQQV